MRVPRIFVEADLGAGLNVSLDEQATRHLVTVLRRAAGDPVILFNGNGRDYPATIRTLSRRSVLIEINEEAPAMAESPLQVHLGIGMSRSQKLDLVLQKATELGASRITPLICERSVLRLDPEKTIKRMQHWNGVLRSSCEQCGRARIPKLDPPTAITDWTRQLEVDLKLYLDPEGGTLPETPASPASLALLNGPEGGITDQEHRTALENGFIGVQAGPRVLRTETAPIVGLTIAQYRWGDLS